MLGYQAPLQDILFVMHDVFNATHVWQSCKFSSDTIDQKTISSILQECARFAASELYPLNRYGDETGLIFQNGKVQTPKGFREAYAMWAEGGWIGLAGEKAYGGMGMPKALAMCVGEMLFASNQAFALYPQLAGGGAYLISRHASNSIKELYLPKLYAGEWTTTMCLTESHCGSDLRLLRTRAKPETGDVYRITGEKIFISGGEHDLGENIVHLVLARLPDAPEGVEGISLFLVPKFIPDDSGACGHKNHVSCTGLEKKMGIKAASTCVMNFDGAKGYLIGGPGQGLAVMFLMMNYERLSIAMQGLGAGDASYQTALAYSKQRRQGRSQHYADKKTVPIIEHGDIRRMLMTMKSLNEAGRAFSFYASMYFDQLRSESQEKRKKASARLSLLTPVVKAFVTYMGFDVCVLGQQVLGGHGYIAEWGQEQHVRDVRIAQIYEGTNGIQAIDLLSRKILADKGLAFNDFVKDILSFIGQCNNAVLQDMGVELQKGVELLCQVTQYFMENKDSDAVNASAVDYLYIFGYVSYGYMWLKMASVAAELLNVAEESGQSFYEAKLKTATFYFQKILPRIHSLAVTLQSGNSTLFSLQAGEF